MNDDFPEPNLDEELDRYRKDFEPQKSGFAPGPDLLQDGSYSFEITDAVLEQARDREKKPLGPVYRLSLRVLSGDMAGTGLDLTRWLTNQEGLDRLGGDLLTLVNRTIDKAYPVGQQLRDLASQLRGKRFAGKKRSYEKRNGTKGHEIDILSAIRGTPMPSASPPPAAPAPQFNEFATSGSSNNADW